MKSQKIEKQYWIKQKSIPWCLLENLVRWIAIHENTEVMIKWYGKSPKIPYTKVSDKTVQTQIRLLQGAVWSGSALFVIPYSILRTTA